MIGVNEEVAGLERLVGMLKDGARQIAVFEAIEQGLADVIEILRKREEGGGESERDELREELREALSTLTVNVAAPAVTVSLPQAEAMPKLSFAYVVKKRDEFGRIVEATLTEV